MPLPQEQMEGLWGDGGPYSHVYVIREIRVLDDNVSRTFYYVKANVNPTTYIGLKAMEGQIDDDEVLAFLRDATFVSDEEGYEWTVYGQAALTPRGANRAAERATQAIVRMHRLVMDALGLGPSAAAEGPGAPAPEPGDSGAASEPAS